MRSIQTAMVAAAIALTPILATAAPAAASHDPNPPYISSSQPGGYELYGFHHKQLSATVDCWAGLQRHPNGTYRFWGKCAGDGRQLAATFSEMVFVEAVNGYGPRTCTTRAGSSVYCVGAWHSVQDLALVAAKVTARYTGGASTGAPKCLESYMIRRGQRAAYAAPRRGC